MNMFEPIYANAIELLVALDLVYPDGYVITPDGTIIGTQMTCAKLEYPEEKSNKERIDICEKTVHELCDSLIELRKEYNALEQKYWDSQRLIEKYDRDYGKLYKHFQQIKDSEMKHRHICDLQAIENVKLRNELTLEKIRRKEAERYLDAYQHAYTKECIKNIMLKKKLKTEDDE